MNIEHVNDYVSQDNECFKITQATIEDFGKLGNQFKVLDAWSVNNSKVNFPQARALAPMAEFDFYLILDSKNSMLFKLAYLNDK